MNARQRRKASRAKQFNPSAKAVPKNYIGERFVEYSTPPKPWFKRCLSNPVEWLLAFVLLAFFVAWVYGDILILLSLMASD